MQNELFEDLDDSKLFHNELNVAKRCLEQTSTIVKSTWAVGYCPTKNST